MTLAASPLRASNRRSIARRPWAPLEPLEQRTLLTALPAPVITAPGNATYPGPMLTTLAPTFQWNPVTASGMTGYQLNLYDWTRSKGNTYSISPSATSFTLPTGALTAGDTYVWNLRLVAGSVSGPPSAYFYFRAAPTPALPAPIITAPGNTTYPGPMLTTFAPTLQWQPVTAPGMTGYQLNLFDWTRSTSKSYSISPSATSFTLPAGALAAGGIYVWNLRIVVGTVTGPPSTYFFFRAPPLPAPVLISPGNTTSAGTVVTTLTPTFQWNPITGVPGMTGYQLNLYDETLGKFTSYRAPADATELTLPSGVLTAGDNYVWNLRLVIGTATGPESAYFHFHVLVS